jgi:hypothetical protein
MLCFLRPQTGSAFSSLTETMFEIELLTWEGISHIFVLFFPHFLSVIFYSDYEGLIEIRNSCWRNKWKIKLEIHQDLDN